MGRVEVEAKVEMLERRIFVKVSTSNSCSCEFFVCF